MSSYSYYNLEEPNSFDLKVLLPTGPPLKTEKILYEPSKHLPFLIDSSPLTKQPPKGKYEYIHSKSYDLQGVHRYTQPQNIQDKIDTFFRNQVKTLKTNLETENAENHKEEQPLSETEDKFGKENRYFSQNPTLFCFRCKQPGHFQKTCPEEDLSKPKCLFCLDEGHHMSRCEAFICYKCLRTGHMARECKASVGNNCYRCGKRGHKARDCRVLVLGDNFKEDNTEEKRMVCLACGNKGHVNCNKKVKSSRDNVYKKGEKLRKIIKNDTMVSNLEYFEDLEQEFVQKGARKKIKKKKKTKKNSNKKKK